MRKFALWFCVGLLILSCSTVPKIKIPDAWSENYEFKIFQGSGMTNYFFQLEIKGYSLHIDYQKNGNKIEKNLDLSNEDITFILNSLKEKKFLNIETEPVKGIIYDKGTTTITLALSRDQIYSRSDSAVEVPKEENANDFYDLSNNLLKYFGSKLKDDRNSP